MCIYSIHHNRCCYVVLFNSHNSFNLTVDNIEAGHYKAKSFKDCSEGGAVRKAITREVFNLLLSEFGVRSYGKRSSYAAASCSEIHSLYPDYVSDNYWIIGSDGTPALEYCSF